MIRTEKKRNFYPVLAFIAICLAVFISSCVEPSLHSPPPNPEPEKTENITQETKEPEKKEEVKEDKKKEVKKTADPNKCLFTAQSVKGFQNSRDFLAKGFKIKVGFPPEF